MGENEMIIAANWKMNLLVDDARNLTAEFQKLAQNQGDSDVDILIFPPALYAEMVAKSLMQESSPGAVKIPILKCLGRIQVI